MRISVHGSFQQRREHMISREDFFSQLARGATMTLVVAVNSGDSGGSFIQISKRDNAVADSEPVAQAGVLHEHRASRGQITNAAVAEPAAAHYDVTVFRNAEFSARTLDEPAITRGRLRDDFAGRDFPAVAFQQPGFNTHLRHAKFLRREPRQVKKACEFPIPLAV